MKPAAQESQTGTTGHRDTWLRQCLAIISHSGKQSTVYLSQMGPKQQALNIWSPSQKEDGNNAELDQTPSPDQSWEQIQGKIQSAIVQTANCMESPQ